MPKILAVISARGGVGKTFVAKAIAECSSQFCGRRTLVVDLDETEAISQALVEMNHHSGEPRPPLHPAADGSWKGRGSTDDLFRGQLVAYEAELPACGHNLLVCPASRVGLQQLERALSLEDMPVNALRVNLLSLANAYDTIILDTGRLDSWVTWSALRAATHALVPFSHWEAKNEYFERQLATIGAENAVRRGRMSSLELIGFAPTRVASELELKRYEQAMENLKPEIRRRILAPGVPGGAGIERPGQLLDWRQSLFAPVAGAPPGFREGLLSFGKHIDGALHAGGHGVGAHG